MGIENKLPPVIEKLKPGLVAQAPQDGPGLLAVGSTGAGIEAKSTSGSGVDAESASGEAINAASNSPTQATIAAYKKNPAGTGAAVFASNVGPKGDAGFFQGTVHITGNLTVDQDILLPPAAQDCAEDFDVRAGHNVEPGTVMVVDDEGALRPSEHDYDTRVAGVISGAGGYRPAMILGRGESATPRAPIALIGKVHCKADARYAPISVGDLLTSSPTRGHAMKASDPARAFGAVIGKALRPLPSGTGMIPILIALQ